MPFCDAAVTARAVTPATLRAAARDAAAFEGSVRDREHKQAELRVSGRNLPASNWTSSHGSLHIQDIKSLGPCLQRPRHRLLNAATALQSDTALDYEGGSGGSEVEQLGGFFSDLDDSVNGG